MNHIITTQPQTSPAQLTWKSKYVTPPQILAKKIWRLVNLTTNIHALINAHPQSTIRTGAEFAQFFTLNELFWGS